MTSHIPASNGLAYVLALSCRILMSRLRTYALLSLGAVAVIVVLSYAGTYLSGPRPADHSVSVAEVWARMSIWKQLGVLACGFAALAAVARMLAATVLAASEFLHGRDIGPVAALGRVRRKHLRLLWLGMILALFPPLALLVVVPISSAIPLAIIENLGVRKAIADSLTRGGHLRLILLWLIFMMCIFAAVLGVFLGLSVLKAYVGAAPRLSPLIFWAALLVSQWWMIALTVNHHKATSGEIEPIKTTID